MARPAGGRENGRVTDSVWRTIPRAPTYELVLDRIEEQILTGQLRVGDRLPAERELAAMLGVSRSAVREAIRALQAQGVLRSLVGNGPESGTTVADSSGVALARLLRLHVALSSFPVHEMVETRVMLERWSVRLAATHASPDDLGQLRELLAAMDDPQVARGAFNELDTAFHVAVAESGGNRLVADLTSAIRESLRYSLLAAFEESVDWDETAAGLRREHHELYRLIAAHEGNGAADMVEQHIRGFFGRMRALLPPRAASPEPGGPGTAAG